MSYRIQIDTEETRGRFNISQWIQEEIENFNAKDVATLVERAEHLLTKDYDDLAVQALFRELVSIHGVTEASKVITEKLLEVIIMIKPSIVIRRGKEVLLPGVAPVQSLAMQMGQHLFRDPADQAVAGIAILAEFSDIGLYDAKVTMEADRAQNRGGHIEVHGDSVIIQPTIDIPVSLYKRIKFTMYLPPMLTEPMMWE